MINISTFNDSPVVTYLPELDGEIRDILLSGRARGVSIDFSRGARTLGSLDELSFLENIETLVIQGRKHPEISENELRRCKNLINLSFDGSPKRLDLSLIPTLQWLAIHWLPGAILNSESSKIRSLNVWGFNPALPNNTWPVFDNLKDLQLVQFKPKNLVGINIYNKLDKFAIHYSKNLLSLEGLENSSITKFEATNCSNIQNYTSLKTCSSIEDLKIHRCGPIPNLHFVEKLINLRTFRFINTDVIDGDISPLLKIEDVMFTAKKHFSHRPSDFKQIDTGFG